MTASLALGQVTLDYGALRALDRVDFRLEGGELHALLGANGAGKSSLVRVLLGLERPSAGRLELDGEVFQPRDAREAARAGIGVVHQHLSLVDSFEVAENLLLFEHRRFRTRRAARRDAAAILAKAELDLDPRALVGRLPAGRRQALEITRALRVARRFLVLDEPTASLAPHEIDALFQRLDRLRAEGLGILLITHRLEEVERVSDRVTVLRNGRVVASGRREELPPARLARLLTGSDLEEPARTERPVELETSDVVLLEATALRGPGAGPFDLRLCAGEIVAVAGPPGNGQEAIRDLLLGRLPAWSGARRDRSERVGWIGEDRQRDGLALDLSVAENAVLHRHHLPERFLSPRRVEERARGLLEGYGVPATRLSKPVRELSGGNQQKVVIARELGFEPDLLVAENPTRGLDLGTTHFVRERLRAVRRRGGAVLLLSTDLDEVLALADRILVARRGELRPVAADRAAIAAVLAEDGS